MTKMFSINNLIGKWYIHYTNFPMWLKGDRTHPAFNYTMDVRNDKQGLLDEVSYIKNGKQKFIRGFDFPDEKDEKSFIWKGNGWMSILSSKWKVVHISDDKQWALIEFEKTLFTPAGFDIVCRTKELDAQRVASIELYMHEKHLVLTRLYHI